jgi:hypothetical protein
MLKSMWKKFSFWKKTGFILFISTEKSYDENTETNFQAGRRKQSTFH